MQNKLQPTDYNDHMRKYLEMPQRFYDHAVGIEIAIKKNQREIEAAIPDAKKSARLADLVVSTADVNEKVLELLAYTKNLLQEIANDAETVMDGARLKNLIQDQSDTIKTLMKYEQ